MTLGIVMELLTPKIADITADGVSLSGDLTSEDLGLTDAEVSIRGTLAVALDLRAVERTICVTGVVEGTSVRQCVRCLKDFEDPIAFSVRGAYERETVETKPEEPDDDLYYYAGDHLDLAPMLREQMILASPMHPLCDEECRGLCAKCGKNLNEGSCHCAAEQTGSPFQVLRGMKEKLREPAGQ